MSAGYGVRTESISNRDLRVEFLAEERLRIVRVVLKESEENVFAELGNLSISTSLGTYKFYGGHRLWSAPETFPGSFQPDDVGVSVERIDQGVRLTENKCPGAVTRKSVELRVDPARPRVTVRHRIENVGEEPLDLAPWAITQLPLGGLAFLPQAATADPKDQVLPSRNLVLWPYVVWGDPRLEVSQEWVVVRATEADRPFKLGYMNNAGWAGYIQNGTLFLKRFTPQPNQPHVDLDCNTEVYSYDRFAELETIGPLAHLSPGQTAVHDETWEFYGGLRQPASIGELREVLRPIGL
ncbi:MAG: hypothetical protein M1482_10505 [Chloroflexi bacterium]|nr:hypothetical protein [Chloroflexota bacterium]